VICTKQKSGKHFLHERPLSTYFVYLVYAAGFLLLNTVSPRLEKTIEVKRFVGLQSAETVNMAVKSILAV
jgi:hypothetical protein